MAKRTTRGTRVRLRRAPGGLTPKHILRRPLFLQVLIGDELTTTKEAGHTEYDTVSRGQFSRPYAGKNAPLLDDLSFESLTLTWDAAWLTNPNTRPGRIRKEIDRIIAARCPVHVMMYVTPNADAVEVSGLFTIRSRTRTLRTGETDTRYYSFELKRYREPTARRRGHKPKAALPAKHKLRADDTLRSLSNDYYGTTSLWRFIAEKNGIKKWGSRDKLLKMNRYKQGDSIVIPNPMAGSKALKGRTFSLVEGIIDDPEAYGFEES